MLHRLAKVGIGDMHLAVLGLDDGRIGIFTFGAFQSKHWLPIITVIGNGHVEHIAT